MAPLVTSKIFFTVRFPRRLERPHDDHIPYLKLRSLARGQLSDLEVIETVEQLFRCPRCFDNYRRIRKEEERLTASCNES